MNYYYLIASLPTLLPGRAPSFTEPEFLERCREQLTAPDFEMLSGFLATGAGTARNAFLREWRERETRLRNAVARARAGRRGLEAAPYLRPVAGFDVYTERAVDEAFARASPAEREADLDRHRWRTIEELAGFNLFGFDAVLAYALRRRLAERWSRLEAETGRRRVEDFVAKQAATR
jgi:hypothetical protein